MGAITAALVLLVLLILLLRQQKEQQRRSAERNMLSRAELLPHHYQSFTDLENRLWAATKEGTWKGTWDDARFQWRGRESELVKTYLDGLSQDFQRGHRIFGQIILHAPEGKIFAQLERQRLQIELPYYFWRALVWLRLRTAGISIRELRHLTGIVAELAQRVRVMVNALEAAGNLEAVEAMLKNG